MERTDWISSGYTASQARFLMATEITHHRFHSDLWGEGAVQKLLDELADIDRRAVAGVREFLAELSSTVEAVGAPEAAAA